jgi:YD repeat-containing protein
MFYRLLICSLMLTAVLICSSTFASANLTAAGTGVISGRVTKLDGTTAIAGASVKVFQGATLSATAVADSAGDYTISGLDPGSYRVEASSAGYETKTQTGVVVSNGATTTVNFTLAVPINYVYDELGRLVSAIDQSGNAATYSYDAVGNLLGISRQDQTQAAIINFSPASGSVGATVTIYGTGFSATASQNTVTFNGTAASVAQSSTTHIVASVPSGATTGPIAVTSPVGSATSSASFIVGSSPGVPSISGFTPTIGTSGTTVAINGANFDPAPSYNKVAFNLSYGLVGSASATSITTTVPSSTGSGRITVITPAGKVTSSADFFIPPPPFTVSDVEFTSRMSIGEPKTVTISTSQKVAMVVFDGAAGQRICMGGSTTALVSAAIYIYKPAGGVLTSIGGFISTIPYIDTQTLPTTGTYTLLFDPESTLTGSGNFTLYEVPPDFTSPIQPGGAAVPVTISAPGQNALLTFNGSTGQKVSLTASNSTIPNRTILIKKPDGSTLTSIPAGSFIDSQTLPTTGVYTVVVDPVKIDTGSITLNLHDASDVTGTITPGGSPLPVTLSAPGQQARITFNGTAGQKVSLKGTNNTLGEMLMAIKNPDGSTLTSFNGAGTPFIDTQALPVTGTYTILIDPPNWFTGSITLNLYEVADVAGSITPGGSPVAASITTPGQNALYSFTGSAGQKVSLMMTGSTITSCTYSIRKPDGTTLASIVGSFIDTQTLPVAGNYTVLVNPSLHYTGNVTLNLYDVVDYSGTTSIGGGAVAVSLSVPGQNGQLTFIGTAGQQVTVRMTGNTMGTVTIKLLKPDGTTMTMTTSVNSNFNLAQQTLPVTGTYTIVIDPSGANTGSINLSVTSP